MQSFENLIGISKRSARDSPAGIKLRLLSGLALGLPIWDMIMSLAPDSRQNLMVGKVCFILKSSKTLSPSVGTLKSTRSRTLLFFRSKELSGFIMNLKFDFQSKIFEIIQ